MEELNRMLKVLIVDDDKLSRMLLAKRLEVITENIQCASNGIEAVTTLKSNPDIDLIMMDLNMNGMDGYEAVRQIRQFNREVIIIAQTATDLTMEREHVLSCGFNDFVLKPVRSDVVLQLIEKHSHFHTENYQL